MAVSCWHYSFRGTLTSDDSWRKYAIFFRLSKKYENKYGKHDENALIKSIDDSLAFSRPPSKRKLQKRSLSSYLYSLTQAERNFKSQDKQGKVYMHDFIVKSHQRKKVITKGQWNWMKSGRGSFIQSCQNLSLGLEIEMIRSRIGCQLFWVDLCLDAPSRCYMLSGKKKICRLHSRQKPL